MTVLANHDIDTQIKSQDNSQIAALQCTLEGAYLIEASAGTGKTWTLTGIILRLLIEKRYPPERIIATTFTRAAAAEMQERISQRLHSFYGLMRWLKAMLSSRPTWFDADAPIDDILREAKAAGQDADDPINVHLLKFVLDQGVVFLNETVYRTGVLLTSLDKLFVGTLDSLAQKWLKEFAAQIGHQTGMQIRNDATDTIRALVHDGLRSHEVSLKNQHPEFYHIFKHSHPNFFSNVDEMTKVVNTAINFFTAPIDPLPQDVGLDAISAIHGRIGQLLLVDFTGFEPYFDANYRADIKINGRNAFAKQLSDLPEIMALMAQYGLSFVMHLSPSQSKFIKDIQKTADNDWQIFNKNPQQDHVDHFNSLPLDALVELADLVDTINQAMVDYQAWVCQTLISSIKSDIAERLESQGTTTFVLQMVRLNQALCQQPALAKHILHHYPVALIDESQDVNGLQAQLIRLVYLDDLLDHRKQLKRFEQIGGDKPKAKKMFLMLVGDPKQAIYRFRGGDVSNYNYIKHYGQDANIDDSLINKSLSLTTNRRSSAALIDALNVWFSSKDEQGLCHADLGDDIFYQHIEAVKGDGAIVWAQDDYAKYYGDTALTLLYFNYLPKDQLKVLQAKQLAGHINAILQGDHQINGRKIMPSDIAVLARNSQMLTLVQQSLTDLGIPSINPRQTNVFSTDAAADLLALITAVVHPNHSEHLGRLLVSGLVGLTLDEAIIALGMEDDTNQANSDSAEIYQNYKTDILTYLKKIYDKWQKQGLSSALAWAMNHAINQNQQSLWLMAARQGERYLADLERLIELVSEQSDLHELRLIDWFYQQSQSPADEYNKRPQLADDIGINLLTIHKSKGLEFAIVYVLGLDDAPIYDSGLLILPYSDHNFERRLSLSADLEPGDGHFLALNRREIIDESRRLGYVALTRASERLYVVARDLDRRVGKELPIYQWLESTDAAELSLPNRLVDHVSWVEMTDAKLLNKTYKKQITESVPISYADWDDLMPKTRFVGEYKTSFTAMITRLDKTAIASVDEADVDQLAILTDANSSDDSTQQIDQHISTPNIAASFIKGSSAGEFLHKVLQFVPTDKMQGAPKAQIDAMISAVIFDQGRRLGIPEKYLPPNSQSATIGRQTALENEHSALVDWVYQIISTEFAGSNKSLMTLGFDAQVRELGFTLGLGVDFGIDQINAAFVAHSDKSLVLLDDYQQVSYRYLRGEIDLVYEADGKFFVVDYKSNYLGDKPDDYHQQAMSAAMDKAGYWLQAALYQVALHRLLKIRLNDYQGNEMQYLGGVEYVFLRGLQADDLTTGHLFWQPSLELILALDAIL